MPIITGVPSSLRKPQSFHRFVYQQGGRSLTPLPQRAVLIGVQKGGTGVASQIYVISDIGEVEGLFGVGQELTLMCMKAFECCDMFGAGPQIFAIPVAENGAATAATITFTVTGPATESGNVVIEIAGRTLSIAVSNADSANTIAAAINAAINAAKRFLPVTSAVVTNVATATVNWKGETGAEVKFSVKSAPAGVTVVAATGVAGVGVNDPTPALAAALGADYDTIALANNKAADIALALTHVTTAWGVSEKKWRWIVFGSHGTIGTATALASAANDKAIVIANGENCRSMPSEIATAMSLAISSRSRPNANWDGLELPLAPPPEADQFTNTEIETALAAGLTPLQAVVNATTRVAKPNVCAIVKAVTTQTTLSGQPFEVLRDLAVSRAGAFIARQIDAKFAERFGAAANPDGVLLDDDAIPRIKDMVSAILYAAQDARIVTGVDADLALLVVEKDLGAPGRVNIDVTYTVVLGLHQVAFVHRVTI